MKPTTPLGSDRTEAAAADRPITGLAAGVPFVATAPPGGPRPGAPIVLAWHLMDPPRTETAFAAALPLAGLDAWRIYLGLPLSGSRLPPGGFEELMALGYSDAVLDLQQPVVYGAARELPAALKALHEQLRLDGDLVGLMGGSIGAAVAQLVLVEGPVPVRAAVLVSPVVQLRRAVEAMARRFGFTYRWSDAAHAVAARLDFVARAPEFPPDAAVLLAVGEDDDAEFRDAAAGLRDALRQHRGACAELTTIAGMGHALADEPGMETAPQSPHAAAVDRVAVEWFQRHLV
ncbi:MAG TPA: prolyl oligopeptidase family serine peptidase [Egibacteraceae bacterium]|nr:prolyl oligopeptidase family serine peptidase [Egibacteraceae bacterium]